MREALQRVAGTLNAAAVPWALTGGYALYAYGAPEPSHDVDIVVAPENVTSATKALAEAGFTTDDPPEDWLCKAYWQPDAGEPVLVDVIFALAGAPVDAELLARASWHRVVAIEMPVLDPTSVLGVKLAVLDEHDCDFAALLPAARALREQVDWATLRDQFSGHPFAATFLDLLIRLDIVTA
jgi:hypothetical protein